MLIAVWQCPRDRQRVHFHSLVPLGPDRFLARQGPCFQGQTLLYGNLPFFWKKYAEVFREEA